MSAPPHPEPQDPKTLQGSVEALTIPDHMMVFRSSEDPALPQTRLKMPAKASRARFKKKREDTPAPPTKGDGRKRLDVSPFPEDKQICKRLDFGAGNTSILEDKNGPTMVSSRCKGLDFSVSPTHGSVEGLNRREGKEEGSPCMEDEEELRSKNLDMAIVCYTPPRADSPLPDSDGVAGEVTVGGQVKDNMVHHLWSKHEDDTNPNVVLGGEEVTLPKMNLGTKLLLESALVPNLIEESHVMDDPSTKDDAAASTNGHMIGENVNLPEMVIETNQPSKSSLVSCQMSESHGAIAVGSPMRPKHDTIMSLASLTTAEDLDMVAAQPLIAGGLPVVGQLNTEPEPMVNCLPLAEPLMEITLSPHEPSLEDFPPLMKGRAMKIRDSFETALSKHGKGSAWPSPSSAEHAMIASGAPEGEKMAWIPAVARAQEGSAFRPYVQFRAGQALGTKTGTIPGPANLNLSGGVGKGPGLGNSTRDTVILTNKATTTPPPDVPKPSGAGSSSASARPLLVGDAEMAEGNVTKPRTMADVLRGGSNPSGPQVFEPDKIPQIGYATTSNGIPAIYFSGAEIKKLADNIGLAIVGKFSHSIPSSHQIQKALDSIKLVRSYTWKYINAKHILVQLEDIADYARLLGGPKGTPVWHIDRHPMRVFKWTPDFDAYCESPIAAIWCNLIGLPIHLFDHSALFAIGKLLGNPIQVDPETANRKRLSFARICVEIDITKPPPEEIILDICGRETVQQVRWGKIPSYCRDCKHVGHTSEVCYASGKMERPEKKNYSNNKAPPKPKHQGDQGQKGRQEQHFQKPNVNTNGSHGRNHAHGPYRNGASCVGSEGPGETSNPTLQGAVSKASVWSGPDIVGSPRDDQGGEVRGGEGYGGDDGGGGPSYNSSLDLAVIPCGSGYLGNSRGYNLARRGSYSNSRGGGSTGRGGTRGAGHFSVMGGRGSSAGTNYMSSNKYYSLMANGDFDVDGCGENEISEMEIQPPTGANASTQLGIEGGIDCQTTGSQGGTSTSSGTILPC